MKCRVGDLAVVVRADLDCNLGNIVHVVDVCDGSGGLVFKDQGPVWIVTCARPMTWEVKGTRYCGTRGPVPDNRLQPIRGGKPVEVESQGAEFEAKVCQLY